MLPIKPRHRIFYQFPFRPSPAVAQLIPGIIGMVIREIVYGNIVSRGMVNEPVGCFLSTDTIGCEQEDQDKWKLWSDKGRENALKYSWLNCALKWQELFKGA